MPQQEVGEFWACSLLDLYGWTGAPADGSAPSVVPGRARLYYNSSDNTVHVITSSGADLLVQGQYVAAGWPLLPNMTATVIHAENVGAGDIDLFTVPAGKKAMVSCSAFNNAGTTTTWFGQVKNSGTYYHLSTVVSTATLVNSNGGSFNAYVYEAGETISINTSQAGLNVFAAVFLFDASAPIKTAKLFSFSSGDNTVYTCPAGKVAYSLGYNNFFNGVSAPNMTIINQTGGAITYTWNSVKSGNTPVNGNRIGVTASIANNGSGSIVSNYALAAGDFISVNTSSNGKQIAWLTMSEIAA